MQSTDIGRQPNQKQIARNACKNSNAARNRNKTQ